MTSAKLKVFLELKATRRSFVLLLMYALCWGPYGLFFMVDCFCDHCLVNWYKSFFDLSNLSFSKIIATWLAFEPQTQIRNSSIFHKKVAKTFSTKKRGAKTFFQKKIWGAKTFFRLKKGGEDFFQANFSQNPT